MEEIKKQGYTHIQFRPQWRWHERIRGEFVWDDLDSLFSLAEKHSLRVILKPILETAPDWVFSKLDGKRIGFHGTPLEPTSENASVIGRWEDGAPAVIEHTFGKGRVITSGGSFSIAVHDNQKAPVPQLFKRLMDNAGVTYEESDIWTAVRRSEELEYRFFYNVGREEKSIVLDASPVYVSNESTIDSTLARIPHHCVIITKKDIK